MVENAVDTLLASYLTAAIPGLNVLAGLQDNEPALVTPYCVVYSVVEEVTGKIPIFQLLTTIEFESISGQDAAAGVATTMTAIDSAMLTPPPELKVWPMKTQQNVGDRRKSVREYKVFASMG